MVLVVWLLACSIKAALLLGASWLGAALLRRGTAAARHQIWTLGVMGALVLPVLCWASPSLSASSETLAIASGSFDLPAVIVSPGAVSTWPAWLAIAWAAGALVVAIRLVRSHLAARRLLRAASPDEAWSAAAREARTSLAIARRVPVCRSERIRSPMTVGVLRPCVLLPAAADGWSAERLRAVLVHELGHVKRHDALIQLAAQVACALYWWNPLAWLAAARLRTEREHACDDLVLGAGVLPSSYATDLLDLARSIASVPASATCMVDSTSTEARLRRILDGTAPRGPLRARFRIAVCGLTAACALTLACTSSPPPDAPGSRGTLSVGAPFVHDSEPPPPPFSGALEAVRPSEATLDLPLVATEVQRRLGNLEACYERRLAANPGLTGTVVIHWNITKTGAVTEACITKDTVGDREIVRCVNKLVLDGGRFPAPRGGSVDVSIPFVFTPRQAGT